MKPDRGPGLTTAAKLFLLGIVGVIVASMLGLGQAVAGIALLAMLVSVMLFAIQGGRTPARGRPPRTGRTTRLLGRNLGTKRDVILTAAVGGFAVAAIAGLVELTPETALIVAGVAGALFGGGPIRSVVSDPVALVVGLGGCAAAMAELFGVGACDGGIDTPALAASVATLALLAFAVLATTTGLIRFVMPSTKRAPIGERVLGLAGLLELAAFVGRPFGVSIWGDAPVWSRWAVAASLAVIGLGVGFAARLVVDLIAVALVVANVWVVTSGVAVSAPCGPSTSTLGIVAIFVVAAAVMSALPGG